MKFLSSRTCDFIPVVNHIGSNPMGCEVGVAPKSVGYCIIEYANQGTFGERFVGVREIEPACEHFLFLDILFSSQTRHSWTRTCCSPRHLKLIFWQLFHPILPCCPVVILNSMITTHQQQFNRQALHVIAVLVMLAVTSALPHQVRHIRSTQYNAPYFSLSDRTGID